MHMNQYKIAVNGVEYDVCVELVSRGGASRVQRPISAPAPRYNAPAVAPAAPAPTAAPAVASAPAAAGGSKVTSPMPGNILSVNVSNGQAVKKGDVLMILEAMKMENEIMAPCDGTVASVNVAQGAAVESGALLCVIQ